MEIATTEREPLNISGSYSDILKLAWPMILSMLSFTIMSFVDIMFVSSLGSSETAAVVFANTVAFQIGALGMGLLQALRTIVAQDFGAQKKSRISADLAAGLFIALILGLFLGSFAFFSEPMLQAIAGTKAQAELGAPYIFYRFLGLPFITIRFAADNYFGAISDTRTPMVVNIIANLVNVVLTYCLVFGIWIFPEMRVEGAGIATMISNIVAGSLAILALYIAKKSVAIIKQGRFRIDWATHKRILKLGAPIAVQFFLEVGSFNAINVMVSHCGDVAMAATGIIFQFLMMSFLPAHGVSNAGSILVGQCQGAGLPETSQKVVRKSLRLAVGFMGFCGIIFVLAPEELMRIFSDEIAVVSLGATLLYIGALIQIIDAAGMVIYGALQGAGDTFWPMIFGVAGGWIVMVPSGLYMIYVLEWGAVGGFISKALHITVFSILVLLRYRAGKWKAMKP